MFVSYLTVKQPQFPYYGWCLWSLQTQRYTYGSIPTACRPTHSTPGRVTVAPVTLEHILYSNSKELNLH